MSDTIVRVENLSKQYRIGTREGYKTFRETLVDATKAPFQQLSNLFTPKSKTRNPKHETIWALKDVSFEVKQGEVLGIIGRNGAGKSTLLKVLSKITEPTKGRVELKGRVGSLLEVGTGFHPELTGHENIYLYGAILGMDRWEVTRKFHEIVAFAELEKFLDTPVKRYSSGMYMRLAFAVAAHLEPEILLVDEVLAVGDAAFQKKCIGKMEDVVGEGRTILFVSHNMAAVQSLCKKSILLWDGTIKLIDSTHFVVNKYLSFLTRLDEIPLVDRKDRRGNGKFRFTSIRFLDDYEQSLESLSTGMKINICLDYSSEDEVDIKSLMVSIGFRNALGQFLFNCPSNIVEPMNGKLHSQGRVVCVIPQIPLPEGTYFFNLFSSIGGEIADWIENAGSIQVDSGDFYGTGKLPPQSHKGVLVDFRWTSE